MRAIFLMVLTIGGLGGALAARAEPFVCFTGETSMGFVAQDAEFELAALQCKTLDYASKGLEAVSVAASAGSLFAACTVAGAQVSVVLAGASLTFQGLHVIVGMLPCDNSQSEQDVEKMVKDVVCEQLSSNGITCRPSVGAG